METFVIGLEDQVSGNANKAADSVAGLVKSMLGLATGAKSLDSFSKGFSFLGDELAPLAPVGLAVAGALLAVGAAAAGLVIAGAKLAIEASALKEKLITTFDALTGGTGREMLATIDGLRGKLGMTREELAPIAEQLLGMGVATKDLPRQLEAIASVKAIGITGGVEEYLAIQKKLAGQTKITSKDLANLYKTGVNVDEVAKAMGISTKQLQDGLKHGTIDAKKFSEALRQAVTLKGASALERQANELSSIWALAKENIKSLFEDVDAGPFIAGLKSVLGMFDKSSASGKAFKLIITQAFNAIFAVAAKVFPYVKAFLLGLAIGALKLYIALKPTIAKLQEFFKGGPDKSTLSFVEALGEGLKGLAPIIELGASSFIAFGKMAQAGIARAQAIFAFLDRARAFVSELTGLFGGGGSAAGGSLIDGIVAGITGKAGSVYAALTQMAGTAIDTLKGALKISSPSKVTEELGKHTVGGFEGGIDKQSGAVEDAWGGAVGAFDMPKGPPSGAGGGGKQITINVGGVTINGAGKELGEVTEESLSTAYERLALMQGAL